MLNKDLSVRRFFKAPMYMTSWNNRYHMMRANFDGFASEYCKDPPKPLERDCKTTFDYGKFVTRVSYDQRRIYVDCDDIIAGNQGGMEADFVVVADGATSATRQQLVSNLQRPHADYVAWHGNVAESEVSGKTRGIFGDRFKLTTLPGSS